MVDVNQGSPEWFAQRCGKVTASRIADVMARTKTGYGAGRANYMAQIVAERLTGTVAPSFSNAAMQWGTDIEPQARAMYAFTHDLEIAECGFVDHPSLPMTGASPDGLIGTDGLVEIKCPNTATHIETLRGASIDRKYLLQMHWQMICTERAWCDFLSFDPRLPAEMQMHVRRVERDTALADEIASEVSVFLLEVDQTVADLKARYQA